MQRMSASGGMYDVALKPKLLRSLLREYVPDEKHPFSNPSELSYVVSTVKTHKLLSEWAPQLVEQDLVDAWKSAVDSWVHRVLTLASSNLPDKCWAGICLLGLTCQECSLERFLASYAVWLDKLLSHIQPPAVSHIVKVASCASLSDILTRLSGFSNAKKDGTSQASRIIQPALKLLNEDSTAVVLEAAICLLCTMINFFPSSVNRHYDSVEASIVSKLVSGKCCASVLKKLGYGLSLLPKSRGDEGSWPLMMDKILLQVNSLLNDAFQGLEEETRSAQTMRALLPCGKESPAPLGGLAVSEQASDLSTRRPERLLATRISTLMQCCCNMLTSSYPVMVPVPIYGLISLAGRVLMLDGSLSLSSYSLMTTLKQEFICSEIPLLQLHGLEILTAVVKGLGSQLLPHVAGIVQLLKEYLGRCKVPDLKIKTYSLVKLLLMSMGVGIAIHVSQDIVSNVFIDLNSSGGEKDGKSSVTSTKVHAELLSEPRRKKRKHSSMARNFQEQPAHDGLEVEMSHNFTPISVKIAALEALEALLTVGGSMRSESWRGNVDHLLITVATNACKEGWSKEERQIFISGDPTPTWADFQLAALRALLASLLSPGRVRPSHLALGLELFRTGLQETGTKLAEYCGHALLAIEVVVHPRTLPLLDLHSSTNEYNVLSHKWRDTPYRSGDSQIPTYQAGTLGKGPGEPESEDDDLDENWLENDDELEIQVSKRQHNAHYTEKPPATVGDPSPDKLPSPKGASITHVPHATGPNDKSLGDTDDYMVESLHFSNRKDQRADPTPNTAVDRFGAQSGTGALQSVELELVSSGIALEEKNTTVKSDVISKVSKGGASTSEQHMLESKDDTYSTIVKRISATLSNTDRSNGLMFESDNELSADSLPDIVDGDPDSD